MSTFSLARRAGPVLIVLLFAQAAIGTVFNVSNPTQLISAINSANLSPGPHTINLAAGTYSLTGELPIIALNQNITFQGASASPADTVLRQTAASNRFLETDLPGNNINHIVLTFNNLTFSNGQGGSFGGGAFLVGGIGSSTTVRNCVFSHNLTAPGPGVMAGGAIENSPNGDLTVIGCRFEANSATHYGGAIDFLNQSGGVGNLVVSNTVFIGNSAVSDGGAIKASAGAGTITIVDCNFEANQVTGTGRGGAIAHGDGAIAVNYNRLFGNTTATSANGNTLFQPGGAATLDANRNWWGQNSGPGGTDIFAAGTVTASTWLQLRFMAGASTLGAGASTSLTADLLGLNSGGLVAAANLAGLAAVPASAVAIFHNAVLGTLSGAATQFTQGVATATFTAGTAKGIASAVASLDNQALTVNIILPNVPPTAPPQTFVRAPGLTLKIAIADVLAACSDPDGGTLALVGVGASAQSATLTVTATQILYQPVGGNTNNDSFSYTVTDGQGGVSAGTITVSVGNPGGLAQALSVSGGLVTVRFSGIYGYSYHVQRAAQPTGPWTTLATQTAPGNGVFSYTDPNPPTPSAFYRLLLQ